jgi:hypothetical protein
MSTVYLVTKGEYSDYRVIGAFSSNDLAEKASEYFASENDIEEFELDSSVPNTNGYLLFSVCMAKDGEAMWIDREDCSTSHIWDWRPWAARGVSFTMWATDEKHAVKIANERRVQLIAANLFDMPYEVWWREIGCKQPKQKGTP